MFIVTNREVDETSTDPATAFGSRPNPKGPNELRMAWAERVGRKWQLQVPFPSWWRRCLPALQQAR